MKTTDLALLPIETLAPLVAKKKVSPVELLESVLERIEQLNPSLNAFITITAEQARKDARRAEQEIARGRCRGPLHGIPISLKDNVWTAGVRSTAGSKVLADFVPQEDATVARRLKEAGAILVGKTNLHEFAYGVTTNNPYYGPTRNPWDTARIPGGSSGGSAVAVATGMCAASIGSDTGGSIRIPAALCGIVGLKPTYGRVSCYGVVPLARSLDHVGPLARTVADVAIVLRVIAGGDPLDETTPHKPVPDYATLWRQRPRRLRLGWPREYFFERLDADVKRAVNAARRHFERMGAAIEDVRLPHLGESVDPSTHIAFAEALAAHRAAGWYPAQAQKYSAELRGRLEAGAKVSAADYLQALEARRELGAEFEAALKQVDFILAPASPMTAPPIGALKALVAGKEETVRGALIRLNRPANLTGLPAISVPCGFSKSGLPIGLQIIARAWDEVGVLRIARIFEQTTKWHLRKPPEM